MGSQAETSRRMSDSSLTTCYQMTPQDANPYGSVYGGTIMKLMDGLAAAVAERHCKKNTVTASIDRMDFFKPVNVGDLLILKASVNYAGLTSLEVGVRIEAESLRTGNVVHTGSSYLTFVALDTNGKPTPVPKVIPKTRDEKRRYAEAKQRRDERLITLEKSRSKATN